MYQEYENRFSHLSKEEWRKEMIHRTLFYEMVQAITSSDFKCITCANYIIQILVHETIEWIQIILDKIFVSSTSPLFKQLTNDLTTMCDFLKVCLPANMLKDDNMGFHSLTHALNKPSVLHGDSEKCRKASTCVVCCNTNQTKKFNSVLFCIWDRIMKKAVLKTVHFNQIMEGSNKQDASAVFSFLEASLVHVIRAFPKIKEIVIQSENAMCYQNTALVSSLPMLNAKFKDEILVKKVMFTETQDGRGPPDVHGAEQKNRLKKA